MLKKYFFAVLFFASIIYCQPIKVYLNTLTRPDDDGSHLTILSDTSKEKLVLPEITNVLGSLPKKFFTLFYSWETDLDQNVSALMYQLKDADLLYIDKNNDNDLTNDGEPILFPLSKDSLNIEVVPQRDRNQKLRLALLRRPDLSSLPDSLKYRYVDRGGNITPFYLPGARMYKHDFDGKSRTFFFDCRITLRKGELHIGSSKYLVGLRDYSNNGLYNDAEDVLLIDKDNSGKLNYRDPSQVFSLKDVFTLDGKNYKLTEIDKYGKYLVIDETKEEPTFHYSKQQQELYRQATQQNSTSEYKKLMLDDDFWLTKLKTLDGKEIDLSSFKGKYLFLNFWGEWCKPCVEEIDELKESFEKYKSQVAFLGIMKIGDLKLAQKLIKEKNIPWINTFITDLMAKRFGAVGFPTNILIFPDGATYIKLVGINRTFFEKNVK